MSPSPASTASAANPFVEMVQALSNRQGQVDIRLDRFAVKLPFGGQIELSGVLSVSVHLRELSEPERKAHESRQVRALSS